MVIPPPIALTFRHSLAPLPSSLVSHLAHSISQVLQAKTRTQEFDVVDMYARLRQLWSQLAKSDHGSAKVTDGKQGFATVKNTWKLFRLCFTDAFRI